MKSQTLETIISTYRKRSFDKTDFDDENEEESETFDEDESFKEEQSSLEGISDNDEDEKE